MILAMGSSPPLTLECWAKSQVQIPLSAWAIAMEKIKIKQEREEGRIPVREEFGDITIVADCYPLCWYSKRK